MNQNDEDFAVGHKNRRDHILEVATVLFCKNGYSGTRMSDIASAINVTKPIVYRYFKSKEELFEVWIDVFLIEKRNSIIKRILNTETKVQDQCANILANALEGLSSPLILAPWRIALLESDNNPKITTMICEKFKNPIYEAIKALFKRGLETGELSGTDEETLSLLFCAPIVSCASMLGCFGQAHFTHAQIENLFAKHQDAFFAAWKK